VIAKADAAIVERGVQLEQPARSLLKKQFTVIRNLRDDFTVYLKNSHIPEGRSANAN